MQYFVHTGIPIKELLFEITLYRSSDMNDYGRRSPNQCSYLYKNFVHFNNTALLLIYVNT